MKPLYHCYGLAMLFANALPIATAVAVAAIHPADHFRVASMDLGALCDAVADNTSLPCASPEPSLGEVQRQLWRLAEYLDEVAGAPAVVALQQVENLTVLNDLADLLDARVGTSTYAGLIFDGTDPAGLGLAFLVDTSRIQGAMVSQLAESEIDPSQGGGLILHPKPPLLLSASASTPGSGAVQPFKVLNVSLDDRSGVDSGSANARARRFAQASSIADLVQQMQHDPQGLSAPLIVVGKMYAWYGTAGHVDEIGLLSASYFNPCEPDADLVLALSAAPVVVAPCRSFSVTAEISHAGPQMVRAPGHLASLQIVAEPVPVDPDPSINQALLQHSVQTLTYLLFGDGFKSVP